MLEWLPQPAIVFDAARAEVNTEIRLHEEALYMGWEISCMGRSASGERFGAGELRQRTELWQQRPAPVGRVRPPRRSDPMLASTAGLDGCTVSATLIAAGRDIGKELLEQVPRRRAGCGSARGRDAAAARAAGALPGREQRGGDAILHRAVDAAAAGTGRTQRGAAAHLGNMRA